MENRRYLRNRRSLGSRLQRMYPQGKRKMCLSGQTGRVRPDTVSGIKGIRWSGSACGACIRVCIYEILRGYCQCCVSGNVRQGAGGCYEAVWKICIFNTGNFSDWWKEDAGISELGYTRTLPSCIGGYTCKKRPCPFRKGRTPACNGRAGDGFTEWDFFKV